MQWDYKILRTGSSCTHISCHIPQCWRTWCHV